MEFWRVFDRSGGGRFRCAGEFPVREVQEIADRVYKLLHFRDGTGNGDYSILESGCKI